MPKGFRLPSQSVTGVVRLATSQQFCMLPQVIRSGCLFASCQGRIMSSQTLNIAALENFPNPLIPTGDPPTLAPLRI